jgi:tetratricopeptide (TPR) repeat protein
MAPGEIKSRILAFTRPPQVSALILQGKTGEAAALAAEFLLEPHCCEGLLNDLRGVALRLDGRFEEAARAADKAISVLRVKGIAEDDPFFLWMRMQRGLTELELQKPAQALASIEPALPLVIKGPSWDVDWGVVQLAHGRALLANRRAAEALEPLRKSYGFWLGHDPKSVWTAEAEYWFGQAWIANGDAKRGRWMVAEAQRALEKSPFKSHRALAQRAPPGRVEPSRERPVGGPVALEDRKYKE